MPVMGRVEGPPEKADGQALHHAGHDKVAAGDGFLRHAMLWPDLAGAMHTVFEGGKLLYADRAACMHRAGCDADLAAHAEFAAIGKLGGRIVRSEEHTSELQSLMRISYAVFCLKKKKQRIYK